MKAFLGKKDVNEYTFSSKDVEFDNKNTFSNLEADLDKKNHLRIVDFQGHLENIQLDFTNAFLQSK